MFLDFNLRSDLESSQYFASLEAHLIKLSHFDSLTTHVIISPQMWVGVIFLETANFDELIVISVQNASDRG